MKCLRCNKDFKAKRVTAKYCSAKCRKLAFRKNGKVSVPVVSVPAKLPGNFGQQDCECMHCQQNRRSQQPAILNHGPYKPAEQLGPREFNMVSLPGDLDYKGVGNGSISL